MATETKALDLTVYRCAECGDTRCFVIEDDKRLTDAELAAEVQGAVFHEAECEVRGLRLGMGDPEHPGVDHWVHWNHEFGRRAGILERFAKLPHYDEARA
ncbi:hypothetical protein [Pseudarthrobacter sp. MEB009]|uniref:hypothetical protein n=1 Tax=Pseudarthrobacter sp. MEB009 TaxID=3040326 RepID=UPI002557C11B|nr:hypothetical protein [Pseudarthrobacter sp. MEB009]